MGLVRSILAKAKRTSIGWSWSTDTHVDVVQRNGQEFLLTGVPNFWRRRLMIVGSSVSYGQGAAGNPPNGWANRLKTLLEGRGWEVLNRGLPGDTTTAVINRWYSDVLPFTPDILIIAVSLNNEGIMGATPEAVYDVWVNNMAQLIRMARQAGIVPVVSSPYPNNGYDATHYRYLRQWSALLDAWNVPTINFLGALDDGTGKYVAGTFVDATHPNDTGHEELFRSVPPSLFDRLLQPMDWQRSHVGGCIALGNADVTVDPLLYTPPDPVHSYTMFFRLRHTSGAGAPGVGGGRSFCGIGGTAARVRNPNDVLQYTSTAGVDLISTVKCATDKAWHDCALSYNYVTQQMSFYVDGAPIGTTTETAPPTKFTLGGRTDNQPQYNASLCEFKDFLFYRAALNAEQIHELHVGKVLKSSLELWAPLSDKAIYIGSTTPRLLNLAPTNSYVLAQSTLLTAVDANVQVTDVVAREIDFAAGGNLTSAGGAAALPRWVFSAGTGVGAVAVTAPIPVNLASASDVQLTTINATTVATFTPTAQGNFMVPIFYRIATAATNLTITVTWTDAAGVHTITAVNVAAQAVGSYSVAPVYINATTGGPITVSATVGTANQGFVSGSILAV